MPGSGVIRSSSGGSVPFSELAEAAGIVRIDARWPPMTAWGDRSLPRELKSDMAEETTEDLQERIQQLEAELAEVRAALADASKHDHAAQPGEDAEWGQFNPG